MNEQVKSRISAIFSPGYNYTYVVSRHKKGEQAAGRVIRTQLDEGVIYLIDDRFCRPDVIRLLPSWWKVEQPRQKEPDCSASF